MKRKFATILAVVMLVGLGVLSVSHTNAKNADDFRPDQVLASEGAASTAALPQGNPNFGNNHGRITRIYPEPTGVYFTFGGQPGQFQTAMNPTNGYYYIPISHPNYRALVDLLYLAAEHDWNLQARTQPALGIGGRADVIYLVQNFSRP